MLGADPPSAPAAESASRSAALGMRLSSLEDALESLKATRDRKLRERPDYDPDPRRRAIAEWQAMEAAMEARLTEAAKQRNKVASTMAELELKMAESDERLAAAQREMNDLEGAVNTWAGNILGDDDPEEPIAPVAASNDLLAQRFDLCTGQPPSCLLLRLPPDVLLTHIGVLLSGTDLGALGGACSTLRLLVRRAFETRALRLLAADRHGWLAEADSTGL